MKPHEEKDLAMVREHIEKLSEHYDTVHCFCTRHESGTLDGTVCVQLGSGNWFARFGQISEWVTKEKEKSRINARIDNPEPE